MHHKKYFPAFLRFLFLSWLLSPGLVLAQERLLQAGPMEGYSEMKEVALWVQTTHETMIHFQYWEEQNPGTTFTTPKVRTTPERAFTATLLADQVEPGKKYGYALYLNNRKVPRPNPLTFQTQELWQFRKDPPDFTFAIGSCAYVNEERLDRPGKPYGSNYHIFNFILAQKPDFMLWLGDNTYLRVPEMFVIDHNFALMEISDPRFDRLLQITLLNHHGQQLWQKQLNANELRRIVKLLNC
jgi:alkaline phosphatase D